MKLFEYEAAEILSGEGIPFPVYKVAGTPDEAYNAAKEINHKTVVKAQVLSGGRGLAGGVLTATSPDDAAEKTNIILNTKIKGMTPEKVIVAKKLEIVKEFYLGITIDTDRRIPVLMAGSGGVDVENKASGNSDSMLYIPLEPGKEFLPFEGRKIARKLGLKGTLIVKAADIILGLYTAFNRYNAITAEINPLVITEENELIALDAKMEIDDSAVKKLSGNIPDQTSRIVNEIEKKGKEIGVTYVDLGGDIGIIASGAGLGMATVDVVERMGLKPANFLETGGGITGDLMYKTMELMFTKQGIRAILINIYGGINPIHEGAEGIARFIKEKNPSIPIVAKALGNRQEETWEIFKKAGVYVVSEIATEKAVERLIEILDMKGV